MRLHLAALASGFYAFLAGCGGSQRSSGHVEPTIQVLDAGSEPRQRLHYDLAENASERMELTFKLRINSAYTNTVLETAHRSADFPTIKNTVRIEVTDIGADGTMTVNSIVEDVAVLDDVVDATMRKTVEVEANAMRRWQRSWRMTRSGRISDIKASAPNDSAAARAQLSNVVETVRESAVIFPDQPLGVGARWQVTSRYVASGVTWERATTYRLKALTDLAATVDAKISMHADSQPLSVEPNATTRLTSATSNASAELVVPLHSLVATATSHGTSEMNLLVVRGHLRFASSVQTEAISSMRPVTAAAPRSGR